MPPDRRSTAVPPLRVVIDTDPGIDDALALLLALASPELDVRAIVTVYGNATLAHATRNAGAIVALAGAAVPVVPGAEQPGVRPLRVADETHGSTGLGDAAVPEPAPVRANATALLDVLAAEPEPVTLATLGPLTNLAAALEADAALVRARLAGHIAMAGSLHARGTATADAEFNVWCDPEAAAAVLAARLPTRWVGLDVTRRLTLSSAEVEALDGTERRRWLRDALRQYVRFHRAFEDFDGCVINDPLVVAELIRPGTVTFARRSVAIGLGEGPGRGRGRTLETEPGVLASFGVETATASAHALLRRRVLGEERSGDPRD